MIIKGFLPLIDPNFTAVITISEILIFDLYVKTLLIEKSVKFSSVILVRFIVLMLILPSNIEKKPIYCVEENTKFL